MGSDYITTTPFYTLDAVDDELLAEILRCDLNEDWTSVLSEERVKERLESQGVICKSREDISWDNATILFTLSISLDSNKIPIKLGDLKIERDLVDFQRGRICFELFYEVDKICEKRK